MKFSTIPYADAALVISLLLAPLPATAVFDCEKVVADGQQFSLKPLGGPHSVVTSLVNGDLMHNTTYTVDICGPLKRKSGTKKEYQCPIGTRVCAIKRLINPGENIDTIEDATPLAGQFLDHGGNLEPSVSRLSKAVPDLGMEGVRIILKGGHGYTDTHVKRKKQTVIDFVCNKELEGTEGEYDSEDKYIARAEDEKNEDENKDENKDEDKDEDKGNDEDNDNDNDNDEDAPPKEEQLGLDKNPSLVFKRYGPSDSEDVDVLHLTWYSKHVCLSKDSDGSGDEEGDVKRPGSHWGAFTWIVILVFLGTAAYLIFGSWLNFTRYGARGWDLLPHGDTIRDIPYLLKDWARRVLNTVQGSGSRGGYSAV